MIIGGDKMNIITRRNFFKRLGLLTGAAVFAPKVVAGVLEEKPEKYKVSFRHGEMGMDYRALCSQSHFAESRLKALAKARRRTREVQAANIFNNAFTRSYS